MSIVRVTRTHTHKGGGIKSEHSLSHTHTQGRGIKSEHSLSHTCTHTKGRGIKNEHSPSHTRTHTHKGGGLRVSIV